MRIFLKTISKTFGVIFGLIFSLFLISIIISLISKQNEHFSLGEKFEFISGDANSLNKIVLIELNGLIMNQTIQGLNILNPFVIYSNTIEKLLHGLSSDNNIKGLIISINSPGGTVSASNKLYEAIKNFKEKNKVKVYIHSSDLLASGGFWSAVASDKIYASYGAMVGAIGVKGPAWYVYKKPISIQNSFLEKKILTEDGIKFYQPYAGRSKDIFNPFRDPTDEEIENIQTMLDSIYDRFMNIVSKNRKIEKSYIQDEIGALVYDSQTAKNKNLIDGIMNLSSVKDSM